MVRPSTIRPCSEGSLTEFRYKFPGMCFPSRVPKTSNKINLRSFTTCLNGTSGFISNCNALVQDQNNHIYNIDYVFPIYVQDHSGGHGVEPHSLDGGSTRSLHFYYQFVATFDIFLWNPSSRTRPTRPMVTMCCHGDTMCYSTLPPEKVASDWPAAPPKIR